MNSNGLETPMGLLDGRTILVTGVLTEETTWVHQARVGTSSG